MHTYLPLNFNQFVDFKIEISPLSKLRTNIIKPYYV